MYELISYRENSKWEEKLKAISKKDIFYSLSYSTLYIEMGDGEPHLFCYEDRVGNTVAYVFLKRKINMPFVAPLKEDLYDIITPSYGYGGPLSDSNDPQFMERFRRAFEEYCLQNNIISEFMRFHPILQNQQYLEGLLDVIYDRDTVFMDLTKSEEEIFQGCHTNHKRNIKKAKKNKLEFKVFQGEKAIDIAGEFYQVYTETMDKLNASQYSYFSIQYIRNLLSDLYPQSLIGAVFYEEKMVAASVCMYEGNSLHYHLGCSRKDFLNLGGNIFLLHQLALWGKHAGFEKFHLGGGHVQGDSLYQYKSRFHPEGNLPFYIGKKVHNHLLYNKLVKMWEAYYGQEANRRYFPIYRSIPKKSAAIF